MCFSIIKVRSTLISVSIRDTSHKKKRTALATRLDVKQKGALMFLFNI